MKKQSGVSRRALGGGDDSDARNEGGGARFPASSFRRMLLDLMEQHPDELKGFVGEMSCFKYKSFSAVIAEASVGGDPLQSPCVTRAFEKIDEAIAKGDEGSTDDDDIDSDLGSDLSTSSEEDGEAEDEVAPLMAEFSTAGSMDNTTEGTLETRSRFAMGDAALRGSAASGTKAAGSRRQLFSRAESARRQESFRITRTSIRETCNLRRSVLRESVTLPSQKTEDALAIEVNYREFLEDEIDQLEKLLDDQEDEIDSLDGAFRKSRKRQKELATELKTTKRSILILEEKYAQLKAELLNANKRAAKYHIQLSESEMEKDLFSLTLESDREHMESCQSELVDLRKMREAGNKGIADVHDTLAQKDLNLMNIMSEMQSLQSELKTAKKQRDSFEKTLSDAAAKKKERKEKRKKNEAS
mmetsp:Transcript_30813/g.50896  ORF Transcript_30813/g.50896 Transcript_30813/m.50896 type:complete len:415 (-) Transcript_30813:263-1507(-)|eukprot:CAMPEP_0119007956 /NCGR_PEP_ID=MMETSP1176-20130426/3361_1 /TAXON_ID=265551 /ORGANISM="Synedropsis recta cf, Strain CCMP1620" /LENGTH=414 /DNA_ID=CAMNT_0006960195 /DNA_START=115 /DNA_END=1359 /DNA_ORIENTATION=-